MTCRGYSISSNRKGAMKMTRRRVSNPLALAVLGTLIERPMHPYEISTTLRERGKETSIKLNYGSLYSVVESLQKHKLIEPQETSRDGRRPERTVYAITEAGRTEFEDWLAELLSTPVKEFTSLEAGLSLMPGLPPDEVARERGLPDLFLVESFYRRTMLDAELEFVAELVRDIRSSSFPGTKSWRRIHELRAGGMTFAEIFADPVRHLGEEARALLPPDSHK